MDAYPTTKISSKYQVVIPKKARQIAEKLKPGVELYAVAEYPNKRVCIIWDNASWHKGRKLREKLKKGQSLARLHLINSPPYAPVWRYAKEKIANRQESSFEKTKDTFSSVINSRRFDYQL